MKKSVIIRLLVLLGLTGCSTVQMPPADDVYFWEETWSPSYSSSASEEAAQPVVENTPQPVIEYTNVQDTTVTVRIKR